MTVWIVCILVQYTCQFRILSGSNNFENKAVTNIHLPVKKIALWASDPIWRERSGSTLAQVMACCLTALSHYLNQCWLIISKVQRHSSEDNFTIDTSSINHWNYLENYLSKIPFKSPWGQWVKWFQVQPSFIHWLHLPTSCFNNVLFRRSDNHWNQNKWWKN